MAPPIPHPLGNAPDAMLEAMRLLPITSLLMLPLVLASEAPAAARNVPFDPAGEPVVLLHGLALNTLSMKRIQRGLEDAGFRACPVDYPSRRYPIEILAKHHVLPDIRRCFPNDTVPIHFVTHSMGGIIARHLETMDGAPRIGRVVMIAPPNRGSEVADNLDHWWLLAEIAGPAARQLGTDSASLPMRLEPPMFEFGVIAATRSLDPLFSDWIPGRDDGKVAVKRTKLEGMRDFVEIPASHTLILWSREAVRQTVLFLREGRFDHGGE